MHIIRDDRGWLRSCTRGVECRPYRVSMCNSASRAGTLVFGCSLGVDDVLEQVYGYNRADGPISTMVCHFDYRGSKGTFQRARFKGFADNFSLSTLDCAF